MSGFKISTGADLDTLFERRTILDPSAQYIVAYTTSDQKSLSERYLPYTSGTKVATTGFRIIDASGNAQDINNYFSPVIIPAWSNYGYPQLGTGSSVRAIHINNGDIYTGGSSTDGLKRYRNGSWSTILNTNGMIWAVHSDGGNDLYVGGSFTQVNSVSYNYIVRYDISNGTINNLGSASTNGTVRAIYALDASRIYVGGQFTTVAGVACNSASIYNKNSNTWNTSVFGVPSEIYAMTYYNGFLYLGGYLANLLRLNTNTNVLTILANLGSTTGGALIRGISVLSETSIYLASGWGLFKWNGIAMTNLYNAAYCQSIFAYNENNIFVGTGTSTNWLAKYNGSTLTTYNNGVQDAVHVILALSNKKIFVGGDFDYVNAGGTSVAASGFAFNG
jgi:hypothetical protein